jgi:hypothetical protein
MNMKILPLLSAALLFCGCATNCRNDPDPADTTAWSATPADVEHKRAVEERARELLNSGSAKDYDEALGQAACQIALENEQNRPKEPTPEQAAMERTINNAVREGVK